MILISHQRSGSEFFLHGLHDITYGKWEVLGDMDRIVGTSFTQFQSVSFNARLRMIASTPSTRAHKIHFSNMRREENTEHWEPLLNVLRARKDLYMLTRRNTRAAIISFMIAKFNNMNFHEGSERLTKSFTIEREYLEKWYQYLGTDASWARELLPIKQELVFEDLLSESQTPDVPWSAGRSTIKERGSKNFVHLIENYDQVVTWMNELGIPGE